MSRRKRHAVGVTVALFTLASSPAVAGIGRLAISPSGAAYAVEPGEGRITCFGPACPAARPSVSSAFGPPRVRALALSPDGARLYAASCETQRRCVLVTLDAASGQPLASREIRAIVDGLLVTPDGRYLLAWGMAGDTRPGKGNRPRGYVARADLSKEKGVQLLELSDPPEDAAIEPSGSRLYLALPGVIQTVALKTWSLSWSFASAGRNRAIAFRTVNEGSEREGGWRGLVCLGMDEGVICYDPRDTGERGVFPARLTIPTPEPVDALFIQEDGRIGAAVHAASGRLTRISWESREELSPARVETAGGGTGPVALAGLGSDSRAWVVPVGARELLRTSLDTGPDAQRVEATRPSQPSENSPEVAALPAGEQPPDAPHSPRTAEAAAPPTATPQPAPLVATPPPAAPPPPPHPAEATAVPPTATVPPTSPSQAPAVPPAGPAPASPPPEARVPPPAAPAPPAIAESAGAPPLPGVPAEVPLVPSPPRVVTTPGVETPPPPTSLSAPAEPSPCVIAGRLSGPREIPVEVVAYGPDSLLIEAATATSAPDGSYRIEGLAPGRYRLMVRTSSGTPVQSDPPYRTVDLWPRGTGGADFRLQ